MTTSTSRSQSMALSFIQWLCLALLSLHLFISGVDVEPTPIRASSPTTWHKRDALSDTDIISSEGQAHGPPIIPDGSSLVSLPITPTASLAVYWTAKPVNNTATNAYIMMHGKLRDGCNYWEIMNSILQTALAAKNPLASPNSIVVAPQFYSTTFNSGQYAANELAWADTNVWQAAEAANHPAHSNVTSIDALDALLAEFSNQAKYPNMKLITFVGHGGGGQLISRYAITGAGLPNGSPIKVRYVVGDPSSNPYFTLDRPLTDPSVANKSTCPLYHTWRYGFDKFNGTRAQPLLTAQQYFATFTKKDIRWVVGYQDTAPDGDNTCMARLQGGAARRDRNLSWWRYINTLAGTNEDLTGFPGALPGLTAWTDQSQGTLNHRLTVVPDADHNAAQVFTSLVGTSALFDETQNVQQGWRPPGWKNATSLSSGIGDGNGSGTTIHVNKTMSAAPAAFKKANTLAAVGLSAMGVLDSLILF